MGGTERDYPTLPARDGGMIGEWLGQDYWLGFLFYVVLAVVLVGMAVWSGRKP